MEWPQFNAEYANQVSEAEFVKQHKHLEGFDLKQVYKDLQKPKEEKKS